MKKFPFLEIGIVIALAVLLYILIYPGYVQNRDMNNKYSVISNMYAMRAAYEKNATLDKIGELPDSINQKMMNYLNEFNVKNPFTGEGYSLDDAYTYILRNTLEINDNTLSSKHGKQRGAPGTFAIGLFQAERPTYDDLMAKEELTRQEKKVLENLDMAVTRYTVIAFDKDSMPVRLEDETSKKIEIYFVKGNKTSID